MTDGHRSGTPEGSGTAPAIIGGMRSWVSTELVGRQRELAALDRAWAEARAGPPAVLLLGGEAGVGKTRLVDELRRTVAGDGGTVLVGATPTRGSVAQPFAPLTAVLPHCRAAVVSGALGGLAAALRAGVPVVIHPQLFDQMWHGRRVEELGVGVMARRVAQVGPAVAKVLGDPGYAERAAALGAELREEDGVAGCADEVESLLR